MGGSDLFRSTSGGRKRPKWVFVALGGMCAACAAAIPAVVAVISARNPYSLFTLLFPFSLFGWTALRYGVSSLNGASFSNETISVGMDQSLHVGGRLLARRSDLSQGFVVPTDAGTLVRLERSGLRLPIILRVLDDVEGESLLRALGFAADHVSARMTIASSLLGMTPSRRASIIVMPILIAMSAMVGLIMAAGTRHAASVAALAILTAVIGVAYALAVTLVPTHVCIGTDGILTSWMGRTRFLAFGTILRWRTYQEVVGRNVTHGVELVLASGELVRLATGQTDVGAGEAQRLAHRITEARAAKDRGPAAAVIGGPLARGHRPIVEWVRALRRMGAGAHDHRSPAVPVETMLEIVENSDAPAPDRAGAALALMASGDAGAKWRVHVAAATTVSPQLRVSLLRIAEALPEDADEALAPLLAAVEAEHR